jgi:putative two-component system response regulator
MVVDSDLTNRTLVEAILRTQPDFDVQAVGNAYDAQQYLEKHLVDLVLIDSTLPDADGFALCSHVKFDIGLTRVPVVLFANNVASTDRSRALAVGAEDIIAKPFQRTELMLRLRNLLKLKSLQDQVSEVEHVLYALSSLIEARDNYTNGHAERVADYSELLGRSAGLDDEEVHMLRRAAFLKDIGKAGIPDELLNRSAHWTIRERVEMTERLVLPEKGGLSALLTPRLLPIIRHCHENYDGTGYPDQLVGEQIPLGSRLLSIADAFDAMISHRPFRDAMSTDLAAATLRRGAGIQWDPSLVNLFIQALPQSSDLVENSLLAA